MALFIETEEGKLLNLDAVLLIEFEEHPTKAATHYIGIHFRGESGAKFQRFLIKDPAPIMAALRDKGMLI